MFADPITITVAGAAKALTRINQDKYSSEYLLRTATDEHRLVIRNTSYLDKKRNVMIDRHNVELTRTVFPVAPATLSIRRKSYIVIENQQGDSLTGPTDLNTGFCTWLSENSAAAVTKLLNFES